LNTIENILNHYESISLNDTDKVRLMNRIDTKYIFNASTLPLILESIKDSFFVLEIKNKRIQEYITSYFDTSDFNMYISHHNGKQNRYKIRHRFYKNDNVGFLEVKFKSNKGRTIKKRIPQNSVNEIYSEAGKAFIKERTPFNADELKVSVSNVFSRITLVNKKLDQRLTIDSKISFSGFDLQHAGSNLAIIEIKRDKFSTESKITEILKNLRIYPSGLSKYCLGMVYLNPDIKKNSFKPRLLTINKIENA